MSRVTVTNPYDLLTDENEDRTNVPAPKKEQKPAAPTPKVAAKPAAAKPAAAKPAAAKPEAAKAAPKPAAQGVAKNSAPQTVKPAPTRDSNQNLQEREKESRAPRTDKRDHQVHPAGARKDKRPFDRKSGTGRPANENKKGGQGKANWGGDVDAKEGVEALKEKEEKVEEEKEGEETKEEKTAEEKKDGEAKEETKEKEKEEFTLDEYLAKRKGKTPVVAALEPRKVNAEDFNAAGLVPLQRGEVADAPLNKKEKKAAEKVAKEDKPAAEKKERENLAAKLLNFSSHQEERAKDRRSSYRREESGQRQGGERRAPRNPNPNPNPRGPRQDAKGAASQPPVQEKDFPSLSGDAVKA